MKRAFILIVAAMLTTCTSKELTRPKVAELVKAEISFATPVGALPLQEKGRVRANIDAGEVEGLWHVTTGGWPSKFILTEKGHKFFDHDFSTQEKAPLKEPARRTLVEITGITSPPGGGESTKLATFSWRYDKLSELVGRYTGEGSATHQGEVALQLFDDGWRLERIVLNEGENLSPFTWPPELEQILQKQREARRLSAPQALELAKAALKDYEPVVTLNQHPAWNIPATNPLGQHLTANEDGVKALQKIMANYKVSANGVENHSGYIQVSDLEPPADWGQYERKAQFVGNKSYAVFSSAEVRLDKVESPEDSDTASASVTITYGACTPPCQLFKELQQAVIFQRAGSGLDMVFLKRYQDGQWKTQDNGVVYFKRSPEGVWQVTGVR